MPEPMVVVAMREFKAQILAKEDSAMREMAMRWVAMEQAIDGNMAALAQELTEKAQRGQTITRDELYRMDRYKRLRAQVEDQFKQYAAWADPQVARYQETMGMMGLDHSNKAIQYSYWGSGILAKYDRLPVEAVEKQVGVAGNGRPVGELLKARLSFDPRKDNNSLDVWSRLVDNLVQGTALGENPRKVASRMKDDLSEGLNKALVIARTEGLRPYRQVTRDQYEYSGVVQGQKRLCTHDGRVCAACLADDGARYTLAEVISDHPQGRCTSVPLVKGMPETTWLAGEEWYSQQPESTQIQILGRDRWEAYRDKAFEFKDLVQRTDHEVWGKGLVPRSLSDLLRGGTDPGPDTVDLTRKPTGPGPRPPSSQEKDLLSEIEEMAPMVQDLIAQGDPTGGGMKSYLDSLRQSLDEERKINQALWDRYGITPDKATPEQWRKLAAQLDAEAYRLFEKYTKEGISLRVSTLRGARDSGYQSVGSEVIMVKRGHFSVAQAQKMEAKLWEQAKEDLAEAMGKLLERAGYSPKDIAEADYYQRIKLLEELGEKSLATTPGGKPSRIDKVPVDVRAKVVDLVDYDLAAKCVRTAAVPLECPGLEAYDKMELAELIRITKVPTKEDLAPPEITELNF